MVLYTLDEASEAYVIGGLSYTDDQMNSKDSKNTKILLQIPKSL
jgi:hypothetical protein